MPSEKVITQVIIIGQLPSEVHGTSKSRIYCMYIMDYVLESMAGFTIFLHTVEACRLQYIDPDVMSLHEVLASLNSHTSRQSQHKKIPSGP
jgi:hypothetical protein